jgi:hypothetical protein
MPEPAKTADELKAEGYVRVLDRLRFSQWGLCETLLEQAELEYEITDNGDPNNMTGGYADLEIDLWLKPADMARGFELLREIPAWDNEGTLGDRYRKPRDEGPGP